MGWWGSRSGYVYVIRGEHGAVKVGHSVDPPQRLGNLQTGSPFGLDIVHSVFIEKDAEAVEASARQNLSRWLIRGEWFDVTPDVAIAAVYGAAARAGELGVPLGRQAVRRSAWPTRFGSVVLAFSPVWIFMAAGLPAIAAVLSVVALGALSVMLLRDKLGWVSWAGAIVAGIGASIVVGLVVGGLASRASAAETIPLPSYDPETYCTNLSTLMGGGASAKANCLSGEMEARSNVERSWPAAPIDVQKRCAMQAGTAGALSNYGALGGCMAIGVGNKWLNGQATITPR